MNSDYDPMDWLRMNRPDKWRKIKREQMEREHEEKRRKIKRNKAEIRTGLPGLRWQDD